MSRDLCHQQEALWELLTTELIYVRKLKIMTDVSFPLPQPWVMAGHKGLRCRFGGAHKGTKSSPH